MQLKSAPSGTIVYSSMQPGNWNLFQTNAEASKPFIQDEALKYYPVYHPEGRYLVFTSEKNGLAQLFCQDTENLGRLPSRLTNSPHFEDQAAFSPDGQKIYFVSTRDNSIADIYVLPFKPESVLDITQAENLTHGLGNNLHPAISPDGSHMVFSSNRHNRAPKIMNPFIANNYRATNIYKINLDTREITRLTHCEQWDGSPTWSLDGSKIYFYSTREDNKTPQIYYMDSNGNDQNKLGMTRSAISPRILQNGRIAYTVIAKDEMTNKPEYFIESADAGGNNVMRESPFKQNRYGAFFHPKTSQCISYGDDPSSLSKEAFVSESSPLIEKPVGIGPFLINSYTQPSLSAMQLCAVRGFFPTVDAKSKKVLCVEEFKRVVLVDIDGKNKMTKHETEGIIGVHWSNDRTWFAAAIGIPFNPDACSDIWRISMDGKERINLTEKMTPSQKKFPRISQDGQRVAFCNRIIGQKDRMSIFIINQDGTNPIELTHNKAVNFAPAFSPDGKKIAYSSSTKKETHHVFLLDTSGIGKPERLTTSEYGDVHVTFSPDGEFIAFSSERSGLLDELPLYPNFVPQPYGDIYVIRISDKAITRITESKWENSLPDWTEAINSFPTIL